MTSVQPNGRKNPQKEKLPSWYSCDEEYEAAMDAALVSGDSDSRMMERGWNVE